MPKKTKKRGKGFGRGFKHVLGLGILIISIMLVLIIGQETIAAVPFLNLLMTLGGFESYMDTVIGFSILLLLVGIIIIALED